MDDKQKQISDLKSEVIMNRVLLLAAAGDLVAAEGCLPDSEPVKQRVSERIKQLKDHLSEPCSFAVQPVTGGTLIDTGGPHATSDGILKTLGNHLCDLLREGECLEIERNFECVSGLSVTAVAANGSESTIGIGPEHMVRQTNKDRFAEAVVSVLGEARGELSPIV